MKASFKTLFIRDVQRLKKEVEAYQHEEALWTVVESINNSGGNLCLHMIGNLNHFIGHVLADTDYVRQRDFEFNGKKALTEILVDIDNTVLMLEQAFEQLSEETLLTTVFPIPMMGEEWQTSFTIAHLYGHLNYHLGQLNYHRRLLDR